MNTYEKQFKEFENFRNEFTIQYNENAKKLLKTQNEIENTRLKITKLEKENQKLEKENQKLKRKSISK